MKRYRCIKGGGSYVGPDGKSRRFRFPGRELTDLTDAQAAVFLGQGLIEEVKTTASKPAELAPRIGDTGHARLTTRKAKE